MEEKVEICKKDYKLNLEISKFKRCKYHNDKKQTYSEKNIVPEGMCPDAYYAAYPYCLCLLYGGKGKTVLKCPNADNYVVMELVKKETLPEVLTKIKKKAERFVSENIISQDRVTSKIYIKVKEVYGKCPYHNQGDVFEFNIRKKQELCPASFHQMFPFIRAGVGFELSCPDMYNVVYTNEHM
jgi:uncharacterized repeat protein (TIGR04076 family)